MPFAIDREAFLALGDGRVSVTARKLEISDAHAHKLLASLRRPSYELMERHKRLSGKPIDEVFFAERAQ